MLSVMDLLRSWRDVASTAIVCTRRHTHQTPLRAERDVAWFAKLGKRAREALQGTSLRFAGQIPGGSETYKIDVSPAVACLCIPAPPRCPQNARAAEVFARTLGGATSQSACACACINGCGIGAGTDTGRFARHALGGGISVLLGVFWVRGTDRRAVRRPRRRTTKACQRLSQPPRAWDPAWSASERLRVAQERAAVHSMVQITLLAGTVRMLTATTP